MQNRRSRPGNRRKFPGTSHSLQNDPAKPVAQERRSKKQDRRIDSIQAAFVNMQN